MSRLSLNSWAMGIAELTAQRSTCLRRHVGCVLLDVDGYILSTGVNGVASGLRHCNEVTGHGPSMMGNARCELVPIRGSKGAVLHANACPGAKAASGTSLDGCHAIHAEQNALLRCGDVRRIYACYCTASPCMTCVKLLMNTSCINIYFVDEYPHPDAMRLWLDSNPRRTWQKISGTHQEYGN
jgi:dCMP deaminase